jgi:zona occludens toxin
MSTPITLVTGSGGSGKTLWTMTEVEKLRRESGRPVFYYGIPEVKLEGWTELEHPHKWIDLPSGAIFIIDESHEHFPQRGPGKAPDFVEQFAKLRHKGYSAFLLTQDRMSLDNFIRTRANVHIHFKRVFGWERSTMFTWQELGDPKDYHSLQKAQTSNFNFPKEVYSWYKSADVHTIQKTVPKFKLALVMVPVAAVPLLLMLFFYNFTNSRGEPEPDPSTLPPATAQPEKPMLSQQQLDAITWAQQFKERVRGQPHSAYFYDANLAPKSFPKISGCGEVKTATFYKCWCNTQQGTIITTLQPAECRFYLKNGWFDPSLAEDEEEGKGGGGSKQSQPLNLVDGGEGAGAAPPPLINCKSLS